MFDVLQPNLDGAGERVEEGVAQVRVDAIVHLEGYVGVIGGGDRGAGG